MRLNSHKTVRFFAAIMSGALAGTSVSAFAYNVSTTVSSPGRNNIYNPLAPSSDGAVGTIDTRMPVIPVGQQQVNCHLTNHKGVDCQ